MSNFKERNTRQEIIGNGRFWENVYHDFSLSAEKSLLGCWGISRCHWQDRHGTTYSNIENYSLELIRSGNFELHNLQTHNQYTLRPGAVFLLGPGRSHELQAQPDGIKLCLYFLNTPLIAAFMEKIFAQHEVISLTNLAHIEAEFNHLFTTAALNSADFEVQLFHFLQQLSQAVPDSLYPAPLTKVLKILERAENLNFSRENLAAAAGISVSTLNRLFETHLHISPGQYRRSKRLEMACRLLTFPNMSLKEVATECGFSSTAFFCREFKTLLGCTPSQYIQKSHHSN